ncbi:Txe/YoeB family addiction module toxin [Hanamia caeni]|jgi:toxin YoeB|uniref:Putative mRNA interferase YoeB n=1 Tax=Hanamia caeni TaxID=2294116 RepID=A0A3M9NM26_9BACT|nr:Txe/YoeB family addiction module toxin [Hanamia caeni]RNI38849.1 Txe/YoeB family addiction module toxin [Hanamia caeni]
MEIVFLGKASNDLKAWKKSGNLSVLKRIRKLIEDIQRSPFEGIGKPEPLKFELSGKWSRRITEEDRIVYQILDGVLKVYSLKGHYEK